MDRWRKTGVVLEGGRPEDDLRVLCPCVLVVAGGFRLFYMGLGRGSPRGTNGRILSAWSEDGISWAPEPGVRLDHHAGAETRVLSPTVTAWQGRFRMYVEAVDARGGASIRSAISDDGSTFAAEPGARVVMPSAAVGSPRALRLADGRLRLYHHVYPLPIGVGLGRGNHVVSAISADGLSFVSEELVRVPQTLEDEQEAVYAAFPLDLGGGRVRLFYGAWNGKSLRRGRIRSAHATDGGFEFMKDPTVAIAPDGPFDVGFASEPCVFRDAHGAWRMIYEGQDATGRARLLGATAEA